MPRDPSRKIPGQQIYAPEKPLPPKPGGRGKQECLLHVYWSALNDPGDKGKGHLLQRDKVMVDLGLDKVPSPSFTEQEMQQIAFAAKMAAINCLRARK